MWYLITVAAILIPLSALAAGEDKDKDYNKQVDNISKVYEASVKVINDGRQEKYVDELDRCYNAMLADIARGGDGHVCGEMAKFVEAKIPTLDDLSTK